MPKKRKRLSFAEAISGFRGKDITVLQNRFGDEERNQNVSAIFICQCDRGYSEAKQILEDAIGMSRCVYATAGFGNTEDPDRDPINVTGLRLNVRDKSIGKIRYGKQASDFGIINGRLRSAYEKIVGIVSRHIVPGAKPAPEEYIGINECMRFNLKYDSKNGGLPKIIGEITVSCDTSSNTFNVYSLIPGAVKVYVYHNSVTGDVTKEIMMPNFGDRESLYRGFLRLSAKIERKPITLNEICERSKAILKEDREKYDRECEGYISSAEHARKKEPGKSVREGKNNGKRKTT